MSPSIPILLPTTGYSGVSGRIDFLSGDEQTQGQLPEIGIHAHALDLRIEKKHFNFTPLNTTTMSKGQDKKKETKKEPKKTMMEKRAEKRAKKESKG
jgi:hypothetical protein